MSAFVSVCLYGKWYKVSYKKLLKTSKKITVYIFWYYTELSKIEWILILFVKYPDKIMHLKRVIYIGSLMCNFYALASFCFLTLGS